MPTFVTAILAFLKRLLPFAKKEADVVAPIVQSQINAILQRAKADVDALKSSNSIAALRQRMEDDIAVVRQTAEHHVKLIETTAKQAIRDAQAKLPVVTVVPTVSNPPDAPLPGHEGPAA